MAEAEPKAETASEGQPDLETLVIRAVSKIKDKDISEITLDSTFEELKVDSLDAVEIAFEVEEAIRIIIPTDQLGELKTVRDVVNGLEKMIAEAKK